MNKYYESPDFEIIKLDLSDCVLNHVSEGEISQISGDIEEPGDF